MSDRTRTTWLRCLTSTRTALWAVMAVVGVLVTIATCFAGDIAIHLLTKYEPLPILRAAARPLAYTDVVLLIVYRMIHRYRRLTASAVAARRVLADVVWRWLWLPFVLVRLLAGVAVLTLPSTEVVEGLGRALTVFLVAVVPLAAWCLAWISGKRLARTNGRLIRFLGLPFSGSDTL